MKKSETKDVTIRMVGDNAKAGASAPSGIDVAAPKTMGNPSAAPTSGLMAVNEVSGAPGGSGSGKAQPDCPRPADTNSVGSVAPGTRVSYPAASDLTSAGGIKTTSTLVEKTGSVQKFPAASDLTSAGGVKDTSSFAKK